MKRKWNGKASLANTKNYVDKIHKLVNSKGISQESAEMLVDQSMINVINVILCKEKESELYKFFQFNNPGLSEEKDVPLAWYSLDDTEKNLWQELYKSPQEPTKPADDDTKTMKRARTESIEIILETPHVPEPSQPNASLLLEIDPPIRKMASISIPDALHESQAVIQQLINAFVSIEITEDITLVKYLIGNCQAWSKWLDWYTVLCSKEFSSLTELQTFIIDKLKEMRQKLDELNLTRSEWFHIVKLFIQARDDICSKRLQTKLCTLELEKDSQKFVYKNFQRTVTFTVNSIKYGHPDFVYVKNVVGELRITKIHKLNEKTKTFTGYLFTLDKPKKFPEYRTSTITNAVTYLERNGKSQLHEFHMHDVIGKCLVLNGEDYFLGRPTDIKEKDVFCCTLVWKVAEDILIENFNLPVLEDGLKKYWGEVYYFKLDGTEKLLGDKNEEVEEIQGDENNKLEEFTSYVSGDDDDDDEITDETPITITIQDLRQQESVELKTKNLDDSPGKHSNEDEDVIIID